MISEEEKIKRLASSKWIKYISCKKCRIDYETDISTEPCYKCGGYEFEQFDLILYPMPKNTTNK